MPAVWEINSQLCLPLFHICASFFAGSACFSLSRLLVIHFFIVLKTVSLLLFQQLSDKYTALWKNSYIVYAPLSRFTVYVCVFVYECVCMFFYDCICVCFYECVCPCLPAIVHVYECIYGCVRVFVNVCVHTHAFACIHTSVFLSVVQWNLYLNKK